MKRLILLSALLASIAYPQVFGSANANRVRGRYYSSCTPTNGQTYIWVASTQLWTCTTIINAVDLSALGTGILKNTTSTGVLSIAVGADLPTGIPVASIDAGSVSAAEFNRLAGVSSGIQTQLDAKAPKAAAIFTGQITIPDFTLSLHNHVNAANGGLIVDGSLALTDVTTNNASTSKHGFLKKLNNDATYYQDGTGNWSVPPGGGGTYTAGDCMLLVALAFNLNPACAPILAGSNTYTGALHDASTVTHTLPIRVVANVGALPASGCAPGELASVTAATIGQQIYENSGTGTCVWTQQSGGGGTPASGFFWFAGGPYSSATDGQFAPGGVARGGCVIEFSTPARTFTKFQYNVSGAHGGGAGALLGIWNSALTTLECVSVVATGTDVTSIGAHEIAVASGGGTCTLTAGIHRLVSTSDDIGGLITGYTSGHKFMIAGQTGGASTANTTLGYTTSPVSTGTGGSLAFIADLSAIPWTSANFNGGLLVFSGR